MSSSFPQPLVAYPQSTLTQPSSHSKGSFGPVFVVLAVITVLAIIACSVGHLFARRLCQPKTSPVGRAHAVHDMEHGFGIDFPMANSPMAKPAPVTAGPVRDGKLRGGNTSKIHLEIRGGRGDEKPPGANFEAKQNNHKIHQEIRGGRGDEKPHGANFEQNQANDCYVRDNVTSSV